TRARVSQPLLLATQIATTSALRARGIEPVAVFGHSVGEVAAAHAAGALTLRQVVKIIYSRSQLQEAAWKTGTMAAVLLPAQDAPKLIVEGGFEDIEVAAVNSRTSITVSGVESQIRAMAKLARARRVPMRVLELDYPFHTALIDDIRVPLISELDAISPTDA